MIFVLGIKKCVFVTLEQRLVAVHAAAVLTEQGLGHEGGIDAMAHGDLLDHEPVGHGIVRHGEGIGVAQVDFVLAGGYLMVAVFDIDAHFFKGEDNIASQVACNVKRGQVKISAPVEGDWRASWLLK